MFCNYRMKFFSLTMTVSSLLISSLKTVGGDIHEVKQIFSKFDDYMEYELLGILKNYTIESPDFCYLNDKKFSKICKSVLKAMIRENSLTEEDGNNTTFPPSNDENSFPEEDGKNVDNCETHHLFNCKFFNCKDMPIHSRLCPSFYITTFRPDIVYVLSTDNEILSTISSGFLYLFGSAIRPNDVSF